MLRAIPSFIIFCLVVALPAAAAEYVVSVTLDRDDALYSLGETATFSVAVTRDGAPVSEGDVAYTMSIDGWHNVDSGSRSLAAEPVTVSGTLEEPGFLRCAVAYTDEAGQKHHGVAAAGFEPLKIAPSMPVPADFDAFWAEKRAALDEVPMNPRLTPVSTDVDGVEAFDVQLDCLGGAPVSGYYGKPAEAGPKSLPAILWVHGAGVRSSNLRPDVAAEGFLVLDINAHGIPNGKSKQFYTDLAKGALSDYRHRGREDRETYYFLGMYFRLMRAMDFLKAQPEWDREVLIVRGSSQGGGQALVAAGLDSQVTALLANVPAMCDHTGDVNGWPRLVPRDENGNPDPVVREVARYFDAMNFATRTKAEAMVSVGFIDNTCRPTTVYAAYNNLRGKKEMRNYPRMTHKVPPDWYGEAMVFMKAHVASRD